MTIQDHIPAADRRDPALDGIVKVAVMAVGGQGGGVLTGWIEAVARANASPYGLGGSIWSNDKNKAYELATKLDSGSVWINKHADLAPNIPFGGARLSGLGSELGEEGLAEFTQLKIINIAK